MTSFKCTMKCFLLQKIKKLALVCQPLNIFIKTYETVKIQAPVVSIALDQ